MIKSNLGLFINEVINEVYKGILMGELENEKLLCEIKESVLLSDEEFIKRFFTKEDIRREIINTFPSQQNDKSLVDEGSLYIPKVRTISESPEIKLLIDYDMIESVDYISRENEYIITDIGYKNIFDVIASNMAQLKKIYIREFIKKGVPKLAVSAGKINTKVIFDEDEDGLERIRGLRYRLFNGLGSTGESELISTGLSNDLGIKDILLEVSNLIILDGYIVINKSNCYKFDWKSLDEIEIEINEERYIPDKEIRLNEGVWPFKIIIQRQELIEFDLDVYIKTRHIQSVKITDEVLRTDILLEENSNSEKKNLYEFSDRIKVNVIDNNSSMRSDLSSRIGEIEIEYRISTEQV